MFRFPASNAAAVQVPNSNNHQIIVTFANAITDTGVTVNSVDGFATATQNISGGVATVDVSNVADAQTITVTLKNVNDGIHLGDVTIPMSVLLGDTTGNGSVNSSDVSQVKAQSGQTTTNSNFRTDVNVNGSINASDVALVKSSSGASLP